MYETLCESFTGHEMKIINFENKKLKLLTNEQQKYENVKICNICKEKFEDKHVKDKK